MFRAFSENILRLNINKPRNISFQKSGAHLNGISIFGSEPFFLIFSLLVTSNIALLLFDDVWFCVATQIGLKFWHFGKISEVSGGNFLMIYYLGFGNILNILWHNVFGNFLWFILVCGNSLNIIWAKMYSIGQIFIIANCQILSQ